MSDYDKYLKLKKYTPSNPKTLINQSEIITSSVRDEIIIKQRILCLLPLNQPQNYPKIFPENRQLFYKHISQGIEILRDSISPQQIQFIAKVYNFFYENPHELVNVILSIEKKEESLLSFIAYSTIPSFFGYFSCIEHLSIAFSFYCALIMKAPKHIIELLLRPFFCNSTTYRFLEGLSSDVIEFFCQDIRLLSKNKTNYNSIINEHCIRFLDSIIRNLKFLPNVHLNILQFMNNLKWSRILIFKLFLSSFIVPQLVSFLSASDSTFSLCLNEFYSMVNNLKLTVTEEQLKPFFWPHSIYEVPPGFQEFDLPFVSFLTTPIDASIIFEAAKPIVNFPKLLIMLQSDRYLGRQQSYAPIWVKVFRRAPKPILYSDTWKNLIFNLSDDDDDKEDHFYSQNIESNGNSNEKSNSIIEHNFTQTSNKDSKLNLDQNSTEKVSLDQNSIQNSTEKTKTNENASTLSQKSVTKSSFNTSLNVLNKPKLKIPHFKRELSMIQMIASEMSVDVFDVITGSVVFPTSDIIRSKLHETSIDLTGVCEKCSQLIMSRSLDSIRADQLCDGCRSLVLHDKKRVTFFEYAVRMELFKLKKKEVLFEKLLLYQFSLRRLKKWLENVNLCFERSFLEIAENHLYKFFSNTPIKTVVQRGDSPKQILFEILLYSKKSGQFFYCLRSEKLLNFFLSNSNQLVSKIKKLDKEWSKEKLNLFKGNKIVFYSKSSVFYQIFSNVTNMVNFLNLIPFHRRYFLIVDCFRQFNELKVVTKSDSSFLDFLKFSSDSSFIITVIEISSLLMKSPDFVALCSKEETLIWYQLENEIQKCLSKSSKLSMLYNELHDFILQMACSAI